MPYESSLRPPGSATSNVVSLTSRTPLAERDDDALMLLARGGVDKAFDELVRRHQGRALRLAVRELGSRALAEDAAQNSFVELYRYLPRYVPQGKLRVLLYRILLNQCRMVRRSAASQARGREKLARLPVPEPEIPEDEVLARERSHVVARALSEVSPRLREVLLLRYASELSYGEIAEVLDVPLGTVKSRIFAGLQKLRKVMAGGSRP